MISSLAPCFTGMFIHYRDALALPGEHASPVAGRDLLDREVTERLISRFGDTYPGGDRRAVVSMWAQWYFGTLIIPTTLASLFLDRDLSVDLDHVSIAFHDNGQIAAIVLPDDGRPLREGTSRFSRLFQGHIEPLIRSMAVQFKVSPRMLWNNASEIFGWTLDQAASMGSAPPEILEEGRVLLENKLDANGRPHPMFGLARYVDEGGHSVRQRKLCCLRYLLPGVECCGSICPTPPAKN